ncbi:MAG TPA: hypothetical protein VHS78_16700 [Candidatus Elarobacter sp.]|jgi:hypothetical protein|nr:hypothetical protein [Candidatus Elarobacter sp.]
MLSTGSVVGPDRFLGRFRMVFGTTIPLAIIPEELIAETWSYMVREGCDPYYTGPVFAAGDDEYIDEAALRDAVARALTLVRLAPALERTVEQARSKAASPKRERGGLTLAFQSFERVREIVPGALYDLVLDREEGAYRRHRRYVLTIGEDMNGGANDKFIAVINSEDVGGEDRPKEHVVMRRKDRETARDDALNSLMQELGIKPGP